MINLLFPKLVACLSAYCIGAFPTGYLFARSIKGIDIREHGSGNVGATNVFRVVGKVPGIVALIIDIAKGAIAVILVPLIMTKIVGEAFAAVSLKTVLGFLVVCGHIWTPFLQFRGGKGVATTIGVLAILAPKALLIYLGVWVVVFTIWKYVSFASVISGIALPMIAVALDKDITFIIFSVTICIINSYRHIGNIKRLLKGIEPKTHLKKKKGNNGNSVNI
ncbi:MAG: glycerol-3-phosphate 1-O-acyltransferase PlsY [Candidatus Omnitrophota bacterium]